ncbi:MAG: transketolase, partial [Clostridiales Family XIII bacterium]|jgi:transketolase|nr:transketolase [Clostridiales Family XIII bacterium]
VLSAGHGSALLYSLLHLFGYPEVTLDELKRFRQLGSRTPGHPEFGHTPGVEATTGPLGAGLGMAVGMAIAEAHLAARFNRKEAQVIDHHTYALCGEGCLMEGISSEVLSLAGTLQLGKLIVLFDANDITIEGGVDLAFSEDVMGRMAAFGFQTLQVEDGNDVDAISAAIEAAKTERSRPSFIKIKTTIGFGVPDRAGTAKAHGEPIGEGNLPVLRESLSWPSQETFLVPEEVYAEYRSYADAGNAAAQTWGGAFAEYRAQYPDDAAQLDAFMSGDLPDSLFDEGYYDFEKKADASRNVSGRVLDELSKKLPNLMGGSADLAPSNKTHMKDAGDFSAADRLGRNLHFGVREIGMTAIGNGIALHGGLLPYVATFFVFADYMKPMLRLSALMGLRLVSVLTHDSIGVGEDGPTHQPVEQLAMLRATPGIQVVRPADETETRAAWKLAIQSKDTPTVLVLTRQNLPVIEGTTGADAERGGYVIHAGTAATELPDAILLASGSEVAPSIDAAKLLEAEGLRVRVVSMPCIEVFESQDAAYREQVLPSSCARRVAVEAGSSYSWGRLVGPAGGYVTMDGFGASAPAAELFKRFGFTVEGIAETVRCLLQPGR